MRQPSNPKIGVRVLGFLGKPHQNNPKPQNNITFHVSKRGQHSCPPHQFMIFRAPRSVLKVSIKTRQPMLYSMDSKLYLVAVACIIGGLAGGYLISNTLSQNQLAAIDLQIQSIENAVNASEARVQVLEAEIRAKDAQIQSQAAQIQSLEAQVQAQTAQIQSADAQIQSKDILIQTQETQIQTQDAQIQAKDALIEAQDAQIQQLTALSQSQYDLIQILKAQLGIQ